ncbi:MAG: phosphatase PAP2 family protein, partial [Clostridia bacterium]|nr:phosphatase PAP2 family protein [Clostridia bacterium]
MKKENKKIILNLSAIFVLFAVLMVLGSFFDLQISHAITKLDLTAGYYYSTTIFGRFFETIGEMPIYLLVAFSGAVIFHNFSRRDSSTLNIVIKIIAVLASVGMSIYMFHKLFKYLSQHFGFADVLGDVGDVVGYILLGICFTFALFYFTRKLPSSFLNRMLKWAFIVFGTALISQVFTHLIKPLASRPRYRAMFMLQNFEMFKQWFEFGGAKPDLKDEWILLYGASSDWFKSFPSGHTSAGSTVITLTLIPYLFEKTNNVKCKLITWAVTIAYIMAVMFNRILVGAHFL